MAAALCVRCPLSLPSAAVAAAAVAVVVVLSFYSFLCFAVAVDNFVVINAIRMRNLWPHARKKQMKKKKQQQKTKADGGFALATALPTALPLLLPLSFFFWGSICI